MRLLIRGGTILTLDTDNTVLPTGDVLIEEDRIIAVGSLLPVDSTSVDRVIDAHARLIIPGLVNAHIHSEENLLRGAATGYPNELWNLDIYPPIGSFPVEPRLHYLRTLLGAMEMVKGGVTAVQDHSRSWLQSPYAGADIAYIQAYADMGMRVSLAINLIDRPWHAALPDLARRLPADLAEKLLGDGASPAWQMQGNVDDLVQLCRETINRWHGYAGRFSVALGPSAPQRCSAELWGRIGDLSRATGLPIHTHLMETRIQRLLADREYGGSMVRFLDDLGVLGPHTSLTHAVWITPAELELIRERNCCVVHNPVCNLYMGSGVMPLTQMTAAGIPLALGTDGLAANGSYSMFESMKLAALLATTTTPDYRQWPTAPHVLRMAVQGGARSFGAAGDFGAIAVGQKADLVLLNQQSLTFTPLHDPVNQLVFGEQGRNVEMVVINGEIVLENGRLVTVDEDAILAEVADYAAHWQRRRAEVVVAGRGLFPILHQLYEEACGHIHPTG